MAVLLHPVYMAVTWQWICMSYTYLNTLKMEATGFSDTLGTIYETSELHITEIVISILNAVRITDVTIFYIWCSQAC
jgi:hypothetical protein